MAIIKYWPATLLLLLTACGDGNGGGVGAVGSCSLGCLNTLANALAACQPSGTCTEQLVGTTAANVCYSNGVKIRMSMSSLSTDAMSMTMTAKKGGVCYSLEMNESTSGAMTMVFKNPSGATIATIGTDASGQETVTCPGGSPSAIPSDCNTQLGSTGTTSTPSDCTEGTCTY